MLWPYLLEFLTPVQYTGAVGIVARCVADIGKRKRQEEAEDYELNFTELGMCICYAQHSVHHLLCSFPVNLPRQPDIIARLIVSHHVLCILPVCTSVYCASVMCCRC